MRQQKRTAVFAVALRPVGHILTRSPDRSAALKRAHEAVAYDTWFREQVQASIDDPRPAVSDEEARRRFAARKNALRKEA